MATDLGPVVDAQAQNPNSVTVDGLATVANRLPEIIAADKYSKARSAAKQQFRGVMFNKLIAAGPVSDQQQTMSGTSSGNFDNGIL